MRFLALVLIVFFSKVAAADTMGVIKLDQERQSVAGQECLEALLNGKPMINPMYYEDIGEINTWSILHNPRGTYYKYSIREERDGTIVCATKRELSVFTVDR